MAAIKGLVKDTAVYGLSSIVGRFLNWCLVPLYTNLFSTGEYGVVTLVYSVVALALIILTYGMETGFFRFANHERWSDPMEVYSTALISLASTSAMFVAVVALFLSPVSAVLQCGSHPSYAMMMAVAVAVDAFASLPFSYLRYKCRPMRFAVLRLVNIAVNIGLNLFFLVLCPMLMRSAPGLVDRFYDPDFSIGYIFLSNLIASVLTLGMLFPELTGFRWRFNPGLWREMMVYSLPLLVLGIAGIMNQTLDKIIYPFLASDRATAMDDLGIYGANVKIAIIMLMFTQAFRFAYEPFIFSTAKSRGEDKLQGYRDAMKYFVIFSMVIFMGVMFYIDILKYFISPKYFSGLKVVPIVMMGEVFFGIFYNLSLWYKLTDKTVWGMWFSIIGLVVTLLLNAVLVPHIGYMGCAWAAFSCYATMMLLSFFVGQKKYPVGYPLKTIGGYVGLAAVMYIIGMYAMDFSSKWLSMGMRSVLILGYVYVIVRREKLPLGRLTKLFGR